MASNKRIAQTGVVAAAIAAILMVAAFVVNLAVELPAPVQALVVGLPALLVVGVLAWNLDVARQLRRLRKARNEMRFRFSEFYGFRKVKRMIKQEPWTYVSLVEASNQRSFAGWKVYDRAVPMFEDQGIQATMDRGTAEFVSALLKAVYRDDDMMTTDEGRTLVARAVAAAREHGADQLLGFLAVTSVEEALSMMDAGIPLEYASELTPPTTSHALL